MTARRVTRVRRSVPAGTSPHRAQDRARLAIPRRFSRTVSEASRTSEGQRPRHAVASPEIWSDALRSPTPSRNGSCTERYSDLWRFHFHGPPVQASPRERRHTVRKRRPDGTTRSPFRARCHGGSRNVRATEAYSRLWAGHFRGNAREVALAVPQATFSRTGRRTGRCSQPRSTRRLRRIGVPATVRSGNRS